MLATPRRTRWHRFAFVLLGTFIASACAPTTTPGDASLPPTPTWDAGQNADVNQTPGKQELSKSHRCSKGERCVETLTGPREGGSNKSDYPHFLEPKAIVIDSDGNAYIADYAKHRIYKRTKDGTVSVLAGIGYPGHLDGKGEDALFDSPRALALGLEGELYVIDTGSNSIREVSTKTGEVKTVFKADFGLSDFLTLATGSGIAVNSKGQLFVGSPTDGAIYLYDRDGKRKQIAKAKGDAILYTFYGMVFDAKDNLYFISGNKQSIQKATPDGTVTIFASVTGKELRGLDIGANGVIYTMSNRTVHRFKSDGTPDKSWEIKAKEFAWTASEAMSLDQDGNLWSIGLLSNVVLKHTPDGTSDIVLGAPLTAEATGKATDTRFSTPMGITKATDGSLIVLDTTNQRILKINPKTGDSTQLYKGKELDRAHAIATDNKGTFWISSSAHGTIHTFDGKGTIKVFAELKGTKLAGRDAGVLGLYWHEDTLYALYGMDVHFIDKQGNTIQLAKTNPNASELHQLQYRQLARASLVVNSKGTIFITDPPHNCIRSISPKGEVKDFASQCRKQNTDDAIMRRPSALAIVDDQLFVANSSNYAILQITPEGKISYFAGTSNTSPSVITGGYLDGHATWLTYGSIGGMVTDGKTLYFTDQQSHTVRKIFEAD